MLKEDHRNGNHLLSVLPMEDWALFDTHLVPEDLQLGQVLHESGARLKHVYFPVTSIVSLLYITQAGESANIAIVGNDGMVGLALFMGGETIPNRAVVQSAGRAYRLDAKILKAAFIQSGAVQRLLLLYTQALITQIAQTAACNRHHTIDQQLCRWLLMSIDRLASNHLMMTQELIANMLGVRRAGVTQAATKLKDIGLIRYSHGYIEVLDRSGLERRACECYAVVKKECDRLLHFDGAN